MLDSEITTDTYTGKLARAAWNEALRRLGCEPQPYAMLGWGLGGQDPTPATEALRARHTAGRVLELSLEIAAAMGRELQRLESEKTIEIVRAQRDELSRTGSLLPFLRRAVGILSDLQKHDKAISSFLNDYSARVEESLSSSQCSQDYKIGETVMRCSRERGKHTVVGGVHDPAILHVARIGEAEFSWCTPPTEQ